MITKAASAACSTDARGRLETTHLASGVVRSGRDPAIAFFGRLMSSLHSGMAA